MRLEDVGLGTPDMNAGFGESISDGLDLEPPEPGHTRPDPCTNKHDRLKCVPDSRRLKIMHTCCASDFLLGNLL